MLVALVAMSLSFEVIADELVLMFDALVLMLEVFVAMSLSFEVIADELVLMFDALVLMLEVFVAMLVVLVLILDSTSDMLPSVKVPSISASLRTVTVPEVWPRDRSPVEKSP